MKYLTKDEWERFVSVIESPRDRAMFVLCYARGLRASEIGMLTIDSVDLARNRITLERLKNSFGGEHMLTEIEVDAVRAWIRKRGKDRGPLFPSQRGTPIKRAQVFNLFRHYAALADLPEDKRHPHVLKHSVATHLMDDGSDIVEVQDRLGHRAIKNTAVYAEVTSKRRMDAAQRAAKGSTFKRKRIRRYVSQVSNVKTPAAQLPPVFTEE